MWERNKCVFPKMGTKTHQLKKGEKRVDPKKTKKIENDRKKRLTLKKIIEFSQEKVWVQSHLKWQSMVKK